MGEVQDSSKSTNPTIIPPYDVEGYARAEAMREKVSTLTDEEELEFARQQSMKGSVAPPAPRGEIAEPSGEMVVEGDPVAILGSLEQIPRLAVTTDELFDLHLDHHMGFILTLIDGVLDFETIVDVCGMPRHEAIRVLAMLVRRRVITARLPR